ncbi:UNVERIFIED_CONTAM: Thioredoxin-like protein 1 [Siphonaria sp. JEL0065]|nr:Thioredoxin-like protein 1 [Siphonaria sp. JEL0065]
MAFVKSMATDAQFAETLATAEPTKLIRISVKESHGLASDFTALWCGPCKAIKPFFAELASKYRHVLFVTVDIDQLKGKNNITSLPAFQFYKGGGLVGSMKGADPRQLQDSFQQALVDQHQGPQDGSYTGASAGPHGSLGEFIDSRQIECLNQSDDHTVTSIFGKDAKQYLESDVDEQLILVVPFNQVVKAPRTIKTFINRPTTLSFDEADSIEPIEVIDLAPLYAPAEGDLVSATV